MLNRTFIFYIIIFCNFVFSNVSGNDQLNFDISQIEIIDGGNKIIGKKRGKITSNNGITVNADQFEYDKINNILKASGNIKIKDEINKYEVSSQNIIYFKDDEKIKIDGKSDFLINSNYNFKTEDITILREEKIRQGNMKIEKLHSWNELFKMYSNIIEGIKN